MRSFWLPAVALALCGPSFAQGSPPSAQQQILNLEHHMTKAALKGDAAAVDRFLASDYSRIYPTGSAFPTDDLRNGLTFSALDVTEEEVHVVGDTAVSLFKVAVKASLKGNPLEGVYRGVRTWARQDGEWRVVAYASIRMGDLPPAPGAPPPIPPPTARGVGNVFTSDAQPKLKVTLAHGFQYIGSFPFDIKGIAGGYRYVFGEVDAGKHLKRVFLVQQEGFYASNHEVYNWETTDPLVLAGDTYQHNVWIYDNDASAREAPGNESDLTRRFLQQQGYQFEPQLVMSRFARIVHQPGKNEIIFFYFENLKEYTTKPVADFPEDGASPEQKRILEKVDANSRAAFQITK